MAGLARRLINFITTLFTYSSKTCHVTIVAKICNEFGFRPRLLSQFGSNYEVKSIKYTTYKHNLRTATSHLTYEGDLNIGPL